MTQMFRYRLVDDLLEVIASELDVPTSRYEAAQRAYTSVGDWLHRAQLSLLRADPQVYVQGSFRLGTAVKPITEEEHYDLDVVCELRLSKVRVTQQQVKDALGRELGLYAEAHSMNNLPVRSNRCWTLEYADGAQFHMDMLPGLPDADTLRSLLSAHGIESPWVESALAITDERHPRFRAIALDWLRSNPKGYASWFTSRMGRVFEERRRTLGQKAQASIESIPVYRVKTPLQLAIQILKRHRDMYFRDAPELKPISIILTTLSAHAYEQEGSVAEALYSILLKMDGYIERRGGVVWIANPSNPFENFADKWHAKPALERSFRDWLRQAREDFAAAGALADRSELVDFLTKRLGPVVGKAAARRPQSASAVAIATIAAGLRSLFSVRHREALRWPTAIQGEVRIVRCVVKCDGFRDAEIGSDAAALAKHRSLRFEAQTNITRPFRIYWQVVNTGAEAERASGLRSSFEEYDVQKGRAQQNRIHALCGHPLDRVLHCQGWPDTVRSSKAQRNWRAVLPIDLRWHVETLCLL